MGFTHITTCNQTSGGGGGGGGSDVTAFTLLGQTLTITTNQPGSFPVNLGLVLPSLTDLTGGQYLFDNTNGNPDVFFQIPPSQFQNLGNIGRLDYAAIGGGVIDANTTTWNNANVDVVESPVGTFTFNNGIDTPVSWVSGAITLTPITWAALLALTVAGTIVPGQLYLVSDLAPNCTSSIFVGLTTKTVSRDAIGYFLNADYQGVGDYTATGGLAGRWSVALEATMLDTEVCIWNNNHYYVIDKTLFNGTSPDVNVTAYQLLPYDALGYGYIGETDFIEVDLENQWISKREDKRGNSVSLDFITKTSFGATSMSEFFQWGNDEVFANAVIASILQCQNNLNIINNNFVSNGSTLDLNIQTGTVSKNEIINGSSINMGSNSGTVENIKSNGGLITGTNFTGTILGITGYMFNLNISSSSGLYEYVEIEKSSVANDFSSNTGHIKNVKILSGSRISATSNAANIYNCELINDSFLDVSTQTEDGIYENCFFNNSRVDSSTNSGFIRNNNCEKGNFILNQNVSVEVKGCNFDIDFDYLGISESIDPAVSYYNKTITNGFNNFKTQLDITGSSVLNVTGLAMFGEIECTSGNATENLTSNSGIGDLFPIRIYSTNGLSILISADPVATATTGTFILEDDKDITLVGRTSVNDFIILENQNTGFIRQTGGSII